MERINYFYKYKSIQYFLLQGLLTELIFPIVLNNADLVFAQSKFQLSKIKSLKSNAILLPNIAPKVTNQSPQIAKENYFVYVGSIDSRKGDEYI